MKSSRRSLVSVSEPFKRKGPLGFQPHVIRSHFLAASLSLKGAWGVTAFPARALPPLLSQLAVWFSGFPALEMA